MSTTGGSNRKKGRNNTSCTRYRATNRRVINKIRKLERHIKKHSDFLVVRDTQALAALKKLRKG